MSFDNTKEQFLELLLAAVLGQESSKRDVVSITKFYKTMAGKNPPYADFGYRSLLDAALKNPDKFQVRGNLICPIGTEETSHIVLATGAGGRGGRGFRGGYNGGRGRGGPSRGNYANSSFGGGRGGSSSGFGERNGSGFGSSSQPPPPPPSRGTGFASSFGHTRNTSNVFAAREVATSSRDSYTTGNGGWGHDDRTQMNYSNERDQEPERRPNYERDREPERMPNYDRDREPERRPNYERDRDPERWPNYDDYNNRRDDRMDNHREYDNRRDEREFRPSNDRYDEPRRSGDDRASSRGYDRYDDRQRYDHDRYRVDGFGGIRDRSRERNYTDHGRDERERDYGWDEHQRDNGRNDQQREYGRRYEDDYDRERDYGHDHHDEYNYDRDADRNRRPRDDERRDDGRRGSQDSHRRYTPEYDTEDHRQSTRYLSGMDNERRWPSDAPTHRNDNGGGSIDGRRDAPPGFDAPPPGFEAASSRSLRVERGRETDNGVSRPSHSSTSVSSSAPAPKKGFMSASAAAAREQREGRTGSVFDAVPVADSKISITVNGDSRKVKTGDAMHGSTSASSMPPPDPVNASTPFVAVTPLTGSSGPPGLPLPGQAPPGMEHITPYDVPPGLAPPRGVDPLQPAAQLEREKRSEEGSINGKLSYSHMAQTVESMLRKQNQVLNDANFATEYEKYTGNKCPLSGKSLKADFIEMGKKLNTLKAYVCPDGTYAIKLRNPQERNCGSSSIVASDHGEPSSCASSHALETRPSEHQPYSLDRLQQIFDYITDNGSYNTPNEGYVCSVASIAKKFDLNIPDLSRMAVSNEESFKFCFLEKFESTAIVAKKNCRPRKIKELKNADKQKTEEVRPPTTRARELPSSRAPKKAGPRSYAFVHKYQNKMTELGLNEKVSEVTWIENFNDFYVRLAQDDDAYQLMENRLRPCHEMLTGMDNILRWRVGDACCVVWTSPSKTDNEEKPSLIINYSRGQIIDITEDPENPELEVLLVDRGMKRFVQLAYCLPLLEEFETPSYSLHVSLQKFEVLKGEKGNLEDFTKAFLEEIKKDGTTLDLAYYDDEPSVNDDAMQIELKLKRLTDMRPKSVFDELVRRKIVVEKRRH